jgi:hypothetical protein
MCFMRFTFKLSNILLFAAGVFFPELIWNDKSSKLFLSICLVFSGIFSMMLIGITLMFTEEGCRSLYVTASDYESKYSDNLEQMKSRLNHGLLVTSGT